jgi:hypothetical protein
VLSLRRQNGKATPHRNDNIRPRAVALRDLQTKQMEGVRTNRFTKQEQSQKAVALTMRSMLTAALICILLAFAPVADFSNVQLPVKIQAAGITTAHLASLSPEFTVPAAIGWSWIAARGKQSIPILSVANFPMSSSPGFAPGYVPC